MYWLNKQQDFIPSQQYKHNHLDVIYIPNIKYTVTDSVAPNYIKQPYLRVNMAR